MDRTILHLDLDAFFCAVEELQNPALVGRPFAVGGRPEERGVVASCSYAARWKGIRSAMPMTTAVRLCPGLQIVPPRHSLYSNISKLVMERIYRMTSLVEKVSIDEAFLDITNTEEEGFSAACRLQGMINSELSLPCSVGVATNKLVAKIANDYGKTAALANIGDSSAVHTPNAITVVHFGEEAAFLAPLQVDRLWGVGPKTAQRLKEIGVSIIGDLARYPEKELVRMFGRNGHELSMHARGIDQSPIIIDHEPKSFSQEVTFTRNVSDEQQLRRTIQSLAYEVGHRLRARGYSGATIKLKLRWPDFSTITRQLTLSGPSDQDQQIAAAALALFERAWRRGKPVRLIGVGISGLNQNARQLSLFDDDVS